MMKYKDEDYLIHDSWIGIGNRFWFRIIKKRRNRFKLIPITNTSLDKFKTEKEAIEYAKHILWCYAELLNKPNKPIYCDPEQKGARGR